MKIQEKIKEDALRVISLVASADDDDSAKKEFGKSFVNRNHFQDCFPLLPSLVDKIDVSDDPNMYDIIFLTPEETSTQEYLKTIGNNLDVCTISLPDTSGPTEMDKNAWYQLTRVRSKPLSELRGKKIFSKNAFDLSVGFMSVNNHRLSYDGASLTFFLSGEKMFYGENHMGIERFVEQKDGSKDTFTAERLRLSASLFLTKRYMWGISIGRKNNPSIFLPCPPRAIKDMFKDRDVDFGKDRRAALKHWVSSHMRRKPNSEYEYIEILDYLRGQTQFRWCGLDCTVRPSQFDIEKYENMKG